MINNQFNYSIIIAVYNTERYLSESIESIINQSYDFNKVQIVLIDDGSTDNCRKICEDYVNKYPNNIFYVYQENAGQAKARNNGLNIASGKYINFLDSDDKLELNALEEVDKCFNEYGEDIDVVVIPRYYFGIVNSPLYLNYKYEKNRLVDINEEYDFPQVSISAAFIRRTELDGNFDNRFAISEDSLLINKTIIKKCKFGVVGTTKYLYRKREEENSTIDTNKIKKEHFNPRMKYYFKELIKKSIDRHGKVLKYIQTVLMYDFQWLFTQDTTYVLNYQELLEYRQHIFDILQVIDDDIILSQRFLDRKLEFHILNLKYSNPNFEINCDENDVFLNYNGKLFDKLSNYEIVIETIRKDYDLLFITGYFDSNFDNISIKAYNNNDIINLKQNIDQTNHIMGNKFSNKIIFSFFTKLKKGFNEIELKINVDSREYAGKISNNNLILPENIELNNNKFIITNIYESYYEVKYELEIEKHKLNCAIDYIKKLENGFSLITNYNNILNHELELFNNKLLSNENTDESNYVEEINKLNEKISLLERELSDNVDSYNGKISLLERELSDNVDSYGGKISLLERELSDNVDLYNELVKENENLKLIISKLKKDAIRHENYRYIKKCNVELMEENNMLRNELSKYSNSVLSKIYKKL